MDQKISENKESVDEKDYIIVSIEFGCTVDIVKNTMNGYHSIVVNGGIMEALMKNGVSFDDVVAVINDCLGLSNLEGISGEICEIRSHELNSKRAVIFDLGDTKVVDGKFPVKLFELQYGLMRGDKWGIGYLGEEKYNAIVKSKISEERFTKMHKDLREKTLAKISGMVENGVVQ